jgi:hypothetical protein
VGAKEAMEQAERAFEEKWDHRGLDPQRDLPTLGATGYIRISLRGSVDMLD